MNFKSIIFFIITISTVLFPAEYGRLSDFIKSEAKPDSGAVWLENPIPDIALRYNEKDTLNVTWVFNEFPRYYDTYPEIEVPSLLTSYVYQDTNLDLKLVVSATSVTGHTDVTYTAYFWDWAYTDSTHTDSIAVDSLIMKDTFKVSVNDPDTEIFEWGTAYSFDPQNTFGSPTAEWIAALDFDLGSDTYLLQEIEFGYAWDGTAEWKIVPFDIIPGDTPIGDLYGTVEIDGGTPNYINFGSATILTGRFAVVFKTTANFMSMDPAGNSDRTWIYPVGEDSLWFHPEDISADYAGAWYIRLLVIDTSSGIEETISSEKSFDLIKNYPNPFNGSTVISWSMRKPGNAQIRVYNSKGEFVKSLVSKKLGIGSHLVTFDASGINSGVYYYELQIDGKRAAFNKMLYLK
ncbi:MAG: T9SS type A sorting domain-containing protein [Candidatus Delongbacteria bacterium]